MKINATSFPGAVAILLTSRVSYNEENTETKKDVDYLCVSPIQLLLFLGTAMWLIVVYLR